MLKNHTKARLSVDFPLVLLVAYGGLCCGQSGNGNPEGRTGNIVQSHFVAEFNAGRIAAMFAANTQFQIGAGLTTQLCRHLHQFTDAVLIQAGKRIVVINLFIIIGTQELSGIVTGEAEGHLGQVVGSKAEEIRFFGNFIGSQSSAGDFIVPTL